MATTLEAIEMYDLLFDKSPSNDELFVMATTLLQFVTGVVNGQMNLYTPEQQGKLGDLAIISAMKLHQKVIRKNKKLNAKFRRITKQAQKGIEVQDNACDKIISDFLNEMVLLTQELIKKENSDAAKQ